MLPIDDELRAALLSPVGPAAWPAGCTVTPLEPFPVPARMERVAFAPSANAPRRRIVETVCTALIALEAELNALDAKVGDGDTGSTFATAGAGDPAELRGCRSTSRPRCARASRIASPRSWAGRAASLSIGVAAMGAAGRGSPD